MYTKYFYKQGEKKFQPPLCLHFLLLHIVLQSNLQPNYAYTLGAETFASGKICEIFAFRAKILRA